MLYVCARPNHAEADWRVLQQACVSADLCDKMPFSSKHKRTADVHTQLSRLCSEAGNISSPESYLKLLDCVSEVIGGQGYGQSQESVPLSWVYWLPMLHFLHAYHTCCKTATTLLPGMPQQT